MENRQNKQTNEKAPTRQNHREELYRNAILADAIGCLEVNLTSGQIVSAAYDAWEASAPERVTASDADFSPDYDAFERRWAEEHQVFDAESYLAKSNCAHLLECCRDGKSTEEIVFRQRLSDGSNRDSRKVYYLSREKQTGEVWALCVLYDITDTLCQKVGMELFMNAFESVYLVDLKNDSFAVSFRKKWLDKRYRRTGSYTERITEWIMTDVVEEDRPDMLRAVQPDNLRRSLQEQPILSLPYRERHSGREQYCEMQVVRGGGENESLVAMGFINRDEQTRRELRARERLQGLLRKEETFSRAILAEARGYFLVNVSRNQMVGEVYDSTCGEMRSVNGLLNIPNFCPFDELMEKWAGNRIISGRRGFTALANCRALTEQFEAGQSTPECVFWGLSPDGDIFCHRLTFLLSREDNGDLVAQCVIKDANLLRDSGEAEEKNGGNPQLIFSYTPENRRLVMLESGDRDYGGRYDMDNAPEEYIRRGIVQPESAEAWRQMFADIHRGQKSGEYPEIEIHSESGDLMWYDVSFDTYRWQDNVDSAVLISLVNVTDRREQMKNQAFEYSAVIKALKRIYPLVITCNLTKNQAHVLHQEDYMSAAMHHMGNYDRLVEDVAATIPGSYAAVFRSTFGRDSLLRYWSEGRELVTLEHPQRGADGEIHWMETSVIRIENSYDDDILHIALSQNIDERRAYEQELQTARDRAERANMAKSEFLSRMSHDIRTPLNGIIGMTDIAKKNVDDRGRLTDCLGKITGSSNHLLSLINDVLDMSRIESGKVEITHEPFNCKRMLDECISVVEGELENRDVQFVVTREALPTPYLLGDPLRLKQILINILGNAVKFTPDGGRITLTATNCPQPDGVHGLFGYRISDTGIGMSQSFMSHIFEPFSQEQSGARTEYKGTGLGMSITKQLVDLMGGTISVESRKDEGSCFTVQIPFELYTMPPEEEEGIAGAELPLEDVRVLLVEDNELNMEIAQLMLSEYGIQTEQAYNGAEAVEIFKNSPVGHFDLIFMDVMMPVMNGYEATRTIRALPREDAETIPVVAMTANAFSEDVQKSVQAGMNEHIAKPLEAEKILRAVRKYSHRKDETG